LSVDENLAHLSNTLIYSSMSIYAVALAAYTVDLSGRGRVLTKETPVEDVVAAVPVEDVEVKAPERARELQAAGVGKNVRSSHIAPTSDDAVSGSGSESVAASKASAGKGSVGKASAGKGSVSRGSVGTGSAGTDSGGERRRVVSIAVSLTWLAFALHLGGVVARGAAAHRVPWGNMYEFSISGAVVVVGVYLISLLRTDLRYLGTFVVGPVLLSLGLGVTVFYTQAAQLVPALQSFWLVIHVSIAFIASGLLTMGFSATVLQLVQDRREMLRASGRPPKSGAFMDKLPAAAELERTAYRLHSIAFPLWTFTLMAGAIWAEKAWGRYWNWDPKEIWTFVIWVVYAGYLHARATRGWDGRRAAYLALVGFGCLLFNWFVVNIYFTGLHSYAGVGKQ
jgi:cytochrome c-type biogenesis protein CcsB